MLNKYREISNVLFMFPCDCYYYKSNALNDTLKYDVIFYNKAVN